VNGEHFLNKRRINLLANAHRFLRIDGESGHYLPFRNGAHGHFYQSLFPRREH
jgi:hypothetical protein